MSTRVPRNTRKTSVHTRPVSLHTQMSREEIDADWRRVQWQNPKQFSAARKQFPH